MGLCCLLSWVAEMFPCACELGCQNMSSSAESLQDLSSCPLVICWPDVKGCCFLTDTSVVHVTWDASQCMACFSVQLGVSYLHTCSKCEEVNPLISLYRAVPWWQISELPCHPGHDNQFFVFPSFLWDQQESEACNPVRADFERNTQAQGLLADLPVLGHWSSAMGWKDGDLLL